LAIVDYRLPIERRTASMRGVRFGVREEKQGF